MEQTEIDEIERQAISYRRHYASGGLNTLKAIVNPVKEVINHHSQMQFHLTIGALNLGVSLFYLSEHFEIFSSYAPIYKLDNITFAAISGACSIIMGVLGYHSNKKKKQAIEKISDLEKRLKDYGDLK